MARRMQRRTRLVREAAELTGGRVFDVNDERELEEVFTSIRRDMDTRYLLSFVPKGVEGTGWHELDVRLRDRPGEVTARRGYLRP